MSEQRKSGRIRRKRTSFAQVSNAALRDETLSLKAKGLLALIESYLSLDNFILYKDFLLSKSKDGETSFRGAWNELKKRGYLIQYKLQDSETKQFYYEYSICDDPQVENQRVGETITPLFEEPQVENPHVGNPPTEIPQEGKPQHENPTCVKPPLFNNTLSNNTILNNTIYTNIIQTNIDYDPVFVNSDDKGLVDNIVDIMSEAMSSTNSYIKIAGNNIATNRVREMFFKVNMNHIYYVLNVIKSYDQKITNIRAFIVATLYNSVLTLDAYYFNMVNSDNLEN